MRKRSGPGGAKADMPSPMLGIKVASKTMARPPGSYKLSRAKHRLFNSTRRRHNEYAGHGLFALSVGHAVDGSDACSSPHLWCGSSCGFTPRSPMNSRRRAIPVSARRAPSAPGLPAVGASSASAIGPYASPALARRMPSPVQARINSRSNSAMPPMLSWCRRR
jgi:hypothetical protein